MLFRQVGCAVAALLVFTPNVFAQTSEIDYANARPLPLPFSKAAPGAASAKKLPVGSQAGRAMSSGGLGDGVRDVVKLPRSNYVAAPQGPRSQEYGVAEHPFTTAIERRSELDPYRRSGKLFFKDGAGTFTCSASLIAKGLVITAAHCVSGYGTNKLYTGFQYIPAYSGGDAPFGVWTGAKAFVPASYLKGTSKCAQKGVVCETDIALIVLKAKSGRYAGHSTGFFGYATGGFSYTSKGQVQITQLGYPGSLNEGDEMIRTDSYGFIDKTQSNNTIIGSGQTEGSSGGPWLANFGFAATPDKTNPNGADAGRMMVVGTTSWGYDDGGETKQQGASFFSATILKDLVTRACAFDKSACAK